MAGRGQPQLVALAIENRARGPVRHFAALETKLGHRSLRVASGAIGHSGFALGQRVQVDGHTRIIETDGRQKNRFHGG